MSRSFLCRLADGSENNAIYGGFREEAKNKRPVHRPFLGSAQWDCHSNGEGKGYLPNFLNRVAQCAIGNIYCDFVADYSVEEGLTHR